MQQRCAFCYLSKTNLRRCSRCKTVFYCSIEHQKNHWSVHSKECVSASVAACTESTQKTASNGGMDLVSGTSPGQLLSGHPMEKNGQMDVDQIYAHYDCYIIEHPEIFFIHEQQHQQQQPIQEQTHIPGLTILHHFLTEEEHENLLEMALQEKENAAEGGMMSDSDSAPPGWESLTASAYVHLMATMPFVPSVGIYFYTQRIFQRLLSKKFIPHIPKQLTLNFYEPHEGLAPHTDNPKVIKEWIVGMSLASSCVITFTHNTTKQCHEYALHPGSIMIQSGDVRYNWNHGIFPSKKQQLGNVVIERGYRVSLQFSDFEPWFFSHPEIQKMHIKTVI